MLQKFYRTLGFALISLNTFCTPIMAYADSEGGDIKVGSGFICAIIGALITGCVLVSKSRQKNKATKADKYIKTNLKLHDRRDIYIRTTTDKVKLNKD